MKKLMMISLLLMVAVFQSAFAQSDLYPFSENKPCDGDTNETWQPFVISFEKECNGKTCFVIVEFYTKNFYSRYYGPTFGFEITGVAYADKEGNKCDCPEENIISDAVTHAINWLVEWTQITPNSRYTVSSLKTCYYNGIEDFDTRKMKEELDKTHSKIPPFLDNSPGEKTLSIQNARSKTKLTILKPCGNLKCCIAYYEIIWNIDENSNFVYGGFKFSSYNNSYNPREECNMIECKDACASLKVDFIIETPKKLRSCIVPSPNNGNFSVYIPSIEKQSLLVIFNSFGMEVFKKEIMPNDNESQIDLELNCQSGTYVFKLLENGVAKESGSFTVVK